MEIWFCHAEKKKKEDSPKTPKWQLVFLKLLWFERLRACWGGRCCPASVCEFILRATFNPKTLTLTKWEEKKKNPIKRQQITVVQTDQCICVWKSTSAGWRSNSVCFPSRVCKWHLSSSSSAAAAFFPQQFLRCTDEHTVPSFVSPEQQSSGSTPVQLNTEISRTLIGWCWKTGRPAPVRLPYRNLATDTDIKGSTYFRHRPKLKTEYDFHLSIYLLICLFMAVNLFVIVYFEVYFILP